MIQPLSFAIQVTYTCPLTCEHCCFSCSPANKNRLSLNQIIETIRSLDASKIKLVAFTGGEPFLLGHELVEAVQEANRRGFKVRVVTSAYFGKDSTVAEKKLKELSQVGLNELSISTDDFHAKFVSLDCVYNVFWAAKKLDLTVAVCVAQGNGSYWTSERVKKRLGIESSEELIVDSHVNRCGRAESELNEITPHPNRILCPCPYVLTGPALSAKNKLLACCGIIPETEALVLDPHFDPNNLSTSIERGLTSPLLNWLFLRGPYAIMEWISKRYNIPIVDKADLGGNCESCRILFHNKEFADKIPYAVAEKSEEIASEIYVLEALGLLKPERVLKMWSP